MKAIVYRRYGTPDVLALADVPVPTAGPGQVLVKVHATSINSWEWDLLTGRPYIYRLAGLLKPKYPIPGADVAGVVEAVGPGVTRLAVGDEVFGDLSAVGWGAMAEYVAAPESRLARKSPKMTFQQAAACPQAGVLAVEGLAAGRLPLTGQDVLINGGGGGAGTFAIQLARAAGARVTAVDSALKQAIMQRAGAHRVLDYAHQHYADCGQKFDLVVDMMLTRGPRTVQRALKSDGVLGVVGGSPQGLLRFYLFRGRVPQKMTLVIAKPTPELFDTLTRHFEAGDFKPFIDRTWSLAQTADAYRYFGAGQARGKLVINVIDPAAVG